MGGPTIDLTPDLEPGKWTEVGPRCIQRLSPDGMYLATVIVWKRHADVFVGLAAGGEFISEARFTEAKYPVTMYVLMAKTWAENECK